MKRSEATQRIEQLLGRVSAGGNLYLDAVEEISVFGSCAAGAPTPHDVDLLVTHTDPTGQIGKQQLARMFAGKSMTTPFEQALRGRQRGLNILFNLRDQLERQGGFTFVLLWQRGDSLETALERLHAIPLDPAAGSAPREYVHPAIEGFEKSTPISARERLIELDQDGSVTVRRFNIERDLEPTDHELRRLAGYGYSESSPRRKAMRALLAKLERDDVPVEESHRDLILTRDKHDGPFATVQHGAERLEAALDEALYRESHRCYCVLNFNGRDPFAVIEIVGARHQTPNSDEAGPE
jgi:hypothetical protein